MYSCYVHRALSVTDELTRRSRASVCFTHAPSLLGAKSARSHCRNFGSIWQGCIVLGRTLGRLAVLCKLALSKVVLQKAEKIWCQVAHSEQDQFCASSHFRKSGRSNAIGAREKPSTVHFALLHEYARNLSIKKESTQPLF